MDDDTFFRSFSVLVPIQILDVFNFDLRKLFLRYFLPVHCFKVWKSLSQNSFLLLRKLQLQTHFTSVSTVRCDSAPFVDSEQNFSYLAAH